MHRHLQPLILGFAVGLLVAFAPACSSSPKCSAATCQQGCCDELNQCRAGTSSTVCGASGNACVSCNIADLCVAGTCRPQGNPGGGSGGSGGGSSGGGSGGSGGGFGGGGGSGGGGTCSGCIDSVVGCVSLANSDNSTFCGSGGTACHACGSGSCVNYTCVGATGGGSGGGTGGGTAVTTVGSPCTSSSTCIAALGSTATCKTQTAPQSGWSATTYPSGFCTLPCSSNGSCPGTSVCAGGASSWPYLFDEVSQFCVQGCSASNTACDNGFICQYVDDLTGATPSTGCWLDTSSGSPPFTGGGHPTKLGAACTADTACASPPDVSVAFCITSWPNGYCGAADLAGDSTWCGSAGTMVGFQTADGGVENDCLQACSSIGAGTGTSGKANYVCMDNGSGQGFYFPSCVAVSGQCSGTYATCVTTGTKAGFCCTDSTGSSCEG